MSFDFQRGFVTGGADKSVKFWDFELVKDENSTQKRWVDMFYLCLLLGVKMGDGRMDFWLTYFCWTPESSWNSCLPCWGLIYFFLDAFCDVRLSVKQTRTLQLDEDVLCVSYSPNQKLLAVSLLDCTVKIFYVDTLKVLWLCLVHFLSFWLTSGWVSKVALTVPSSSVFLKTCMWIKTLGGTLGQLEF